MRALLDINVIIALLDSAHVMHRAACGWMEQAVDHGWATCPMTENGVMRIMSQPAYPNGRPAQQVVQRLAEVCGHPSHQFWPETISLLHPGRIHWQQILGSRQITDAYLLALAVAQGGRFVSFDQRIGIEVVPKATAEHLAISKC